MLHAMLTVKWVAYNNRENIEEKFIYNILIIFKTFSTGAKAED